MSNQTFRASLSTRSALLFIILFTSALLLRAPDILDFHIWAEDGKLFISGHFDKGLAALFSPWAGYLHIAPRLTAAGLYFVPLEYALIWFTCVAVAITTWSASILFRAFGQRFAGATAAASVIAASGLWEILGTVTNLQWIMAPTMIVAVMWHRKFSPLEICSFCILASLSGPFSVAFAPVFFLIFVSDFRARKQINVPAIICIIGGIIQFLVIIASTGGAMETGGEPPSASPEPLWLFARLLSLSVGGSWTLIAAATPLVIASFFGKFRRERITLIACILLLTLVTTIKFHSAPDTFETGLIGGRYWYPLSFMWLLIISSLLREPLLGPRLTGIAALATTLVISYSSPLSRTWPWPSDDWGTFVKNARNGPAVYRYPPYWELSLDLSASDKRN